MKKSSLYGMGTLVFALLLAGCGRQASSVNTETATAYDSLVYAPSDTLSEEAIHQDIERQCTALYNYVTRVDETYAYTLYFLTPSLRKLLDQLQELPDEYYEYGCDYNLFTLSVEKPDEIIPKILSFEKQSDGSYLVNVLLWDTELLGRQERTLLYKNINGQWLVDDFGGDRAKIEAYIKNAHAEMKQHATATDSLREAEGNPESVSQTEDD